MAFASLAAALVALASVHASTIFAQSSQEGAGAVSNKKLKHDTCGSVMSINQNKLHMGFTRLLYVVVVGRPFNCTVQHI